VHLTPAVQPLLSEMDAVLDQTRQQVLEGLSETELAELERMVRHIGANLQKMSAQLGDGKEGER
jgi:MarR family transcriptional regulator for hemolysin